MGVLELLPALALQSKYAFPRVNLSFLCTAHLTVASFAAARACVWRFCCRVSVSFKGLPFFKSVGAKPLFGMFVRREASFWESPPLPLSDGNVLRR